jgi:apolipoprotein N-acyltransferase
VQRDLARAGLGGVLVTLAVPPFGWWPLAILGVALLVDALHPAPSLPNPSFSVWERARSGPFPYRERVWVGFAFGLGFLLPGLWWMHEFTLPGFVLAAIFESALLAAGILLARGTATLVAGLVLAEAVRASWPWGGVPVPTIAHTQVGGPAAQVARLGGELLITALVLAAGVALQRAWRRQLLPATAIAATIVAVVTAGAVAPDGRAGERLAVAAVQGGGERGTRAIDTDEDVVFDRHVRASDDIDDRAELVLWPENAVHVDDPVEQTPEGDALSAIARGRTLVAGVVIGGEAEGDSDVFVNLATAWGPDGGVIERYEKNARVPFGEFIPFRSIVERLGDVSAVPRDARVGHGPGFIQTPAGDLGIVISWEVFFADRARDAISSGGEVLLVPTNAASFSTAQMPALELGAARLRAIETGRWVVQAAPTGFSAFITPRGRVLEHSDLGAREVLHHDVVLRSGTTFYTRLGDGPFVAASIAALVLGRLRSWRARTTTGTDTATTSADPSTTP